MRKDTLFVLRLWRDGTTPKDWRYSLEDLRSRERTNFTTLEALYTFIAEQTREQED